MEDTLQRLIYGKPLSNEAPEPDFTTLALTDGWNAADAYELMAQVPLFPLQAAADSAQDNQMNERQTPIGTQALALMPWPANGQRADRYILARCQYQVEGRQSPTYEYIDVPTKVLVALAGNLRPLLDALPEAIPYYKATHVPLDPLKVPQTQALTPQSRQRRLAHLLDVLPEHNFVLAVKLLAAALDDAAPLLITGYQAHMPDRLSLIEGLSALLPSRSAHVLTFSGHADRLNVPLPAIVFFDDEAQTTNTASSRSGRTQTSGIAAHQVTWPQLMQQPTHTIDSLPDHPYTQHLQRLWDDVTGQQADTAKSADHIAALAERLSELEELAQVPTEHENLSAWLAAIVAQHQQDIAVRTGGEVTMQAIIDTLNSANAPEGERRYQYLERLMQQALEERDTETSAYIAQLMDTDPTLDERLSRSLDNALDDQPDAVYFFVRTRLNTQGPDEHWLERLHVAATHALEVAITSGDPNTLSVWMRLISREPANYNLGSILHEGIIAARKRVSEDNSLARELITIAMKRDMAALSSILEDETVLNALSDELVGALRDHDSSAIEAMAEQSREIFLLSLVRAMDEGEPRITSAAVRSLWDYFRKRGAATLPTPYRPATVIRRMTSDGLAALADGALETLLTLLLARGNHDALFYEVTPGLSQQRRLAPLLVSILEQCGRSIEDQLEIVGYLTTSEVITPQQAVDTYTTLLADQDWRAAARPLVEQVTRLLNQNANVSTSLGVLWKILELGSELRSEAMVRGTTRRLLTEMVDMAVEVQFVENLLRLRRATSWSANIRNMILGWWRGHVRTLAIGQLQKLDRAMEGKRPIEDMRQIVTTTIALRRLMGGKTLHEFAQDISTAYNVLQAIADGFDPSDKQATALSVDLQTVRNELDARGEEIALDAQHVLATNLRELAQLITSLADKRSKSSLMRSDDVIERQLVMGEQHPQSAIDVMKWLSGYLDGSQDDDS